MNYINGYIPEEQNVKTFKNWTERTSVIDYQFSVVGITDEQTGRRTGKTHPQTRE